MIECQSVNGQGASVAYLDDAFTPAAPDQASMAKVVFDNGDVIWWQPEQQAQDAGFNPSEPRDREGEWTKGGGSHKGKSVTVYHGTSEKYLESIKKHGLRPSHGGGADKWLKLTQGRAALTNMKAMGGPKSAVYVTRNRAEAEVFAQAAAEVTITGHKIWAPIVLKLHVPKAEFDKTFRRDERDPGGSGLRTVNIVPPEWIVDGWQDMAQDEQVIEAYMVVLPDEDDTDIAADAWNPAKHPREPKGTSIGGEFASAGTTGEEEEAAKEAEANGELPALTAPPPWKQSEGGTAYEIVPGTWVPAPEAEGYWADLNKSMGPDDAAINAADPFFMTGYIGKPQLTPKQGTTEYDHWIAIKPGPQEKVEPSNNKGGGQYAGMYVTSGKTPKENHDLTVQKVLSQPALKGIHYRRLLGRLIKDSPAFATVQLIPQLKAKLIDALQMTADGLIQKDKLGEAGKVLQTLHKLGASEDVIVPLEKKLDDVSITGPKPSPSPEVTTAPPKPYEQAYKEYLQNAAEKKLSNFIASGISNKEALLNELTFGENMSLKDKYGSITNAIAAAAGKANEQYAAAAQAASAAPAATTMPQLPSSQISKATPSELEKAKKTSAFYPAPTSAEGQAIVKPFNDLYEGKTITDPAALEKKVADYKATAKALQAIEAKEQTAKQQAHAEALKKQAEQEKAEKAKAAEQKAKEQAELKAMMADLGVADPNDALAVQGFLSLAGGADLATKTMITQFKTWKEEGKHKGLPISPFEYAMLRSYTGSGYHKINSSLRQGVWSVKQHVFANAVNKALKALPPWPAETKRGADLPKNIQERYAQPGNVVEEYAFTSTSKTNPWGGNTQWHITGKSGRDISHVSSSPGEAEVLYPARTFFRIDKVEGVPGSGTMEVWMTEVDAI